MKKSSVSKVKVPVEVVLGATELTVEQIAGFEAGKVIQLDSLAGEPVSVTAAGKRVATGEVVVIDEYFGIRITGIVNGA